MISFETYQKIRELYDIGLSMQKISRKLHLAPETVKRWIVSEEETFLELQNTRFRYLDQYKEFMLEQIRACPLIIPATGNRQSGQQETASPDDRKPSVRTCGNRCLRVYSREFLSNPYTSLIEIS